MNRLLLGSLLAALAMFVWGFIFWATPISGLVVDQMQPDQGVAVADALSANLPETGVYYIPAMGDDEEAWAAAHEAGPLATIFFRTDGSAPMSASTFILGFLHMAIGALLLALLMRMCIGVLPTYANRVIFAVLVGIIVAWWAHVAGPIWYYQPWGYHLGTAVYDVVSWFLAGLVLARFVSPEHQPDTAQEMAAAA